MSLVCAECQTSNADGTMFCRSCGVSLAFAIDTKSVSVPSVASAALRNPFPDEPAPAARGARVVPWLTGAVLTLLLVGAAATGWQALQNLRAPSDMGNVPVTVLEPADGQPPMAPDLQDTLSDVATPANELTMTEMLPQVAEPPPVVAPPVVPKKAKTVRAVRPRGEARQAADADADADADPYADDAQPVFRRSAQAGPVGGGPASACYGRTGDALDVCISNRCRQALYRNHPVCRGF